jgi:hypothetical protein
MPFANGYAYAFNNPLLLHDITGEWAECGPIGSVCDGSNLIPAFNRYSRALDDTRYLRLYRTLSTEQADEIGYDDMSYIHADAANRLEHMQVCANNPGQCEEPCPDEGYQACQARRGGAVLGGFVLGQVAGVALPALLGRACAADARVAANAGTARLVVNSAGDVLDTTRVLIPAGKFDYLLKNPSKSGVFSDSMGFDQAGLDSALRSHLTGNFGSASSSVPMVGGGTKFTVRGPMTGPSGQTWDITTAWGVDPNGTIRLITATP